MAQIKYSFILPCRNEVGAVGKCIDMARAAMTQFGESRYEIIVADSSTDGSDVIARRKGATVVRHNEPGYGRAILAGVRHASGEVLIIADCDATYDLREAAKLVSQAAAGTLVIGKRSSIRRGAMPAFHRYVGTPLLSSFLSILFHQRITDNNSGFRVVYKSDFERLSLRTSGMEFASEMLVKALLRGFRIVEVPITYHRRIGQSKLATWSDGWRHFRFLVAYVPLNIFFVGGITAFIVGLILLFASLEGSFSVLNTTFYRSVSFVGSFLCYAGFTVLQTSIIAKIVVKQRGLGAEERLLTRLAKLRFETVMGGAMLILLFFLLAIGRTIYNWWFLHIILNTNLLVALLTGATIAFQAVITAFLVSFLLVETK